MKISSLLAVIFSLIQIPILFALTPVIRETLLEVWNPQTSGTELIWGTLTTLITLGFFLGGVWYLWHFANSKGLGLFRNVD